MDYDFRAISNRLYEAMHRKYKSVSDFYEKRGKELGMSLDTLKNHIRKSDEPPKVNSIHLEYLCIYAQEFNVSADFILFGDNSSKKEISKNDVFNALDIIRNAFGKYAFSSTVSLRNDLYEMFEKYDNFQTIDINDIGKWLKNFDDEGSEYFIPEYFFNIKNKYIDDYLNLIYRLEAVKNEISESAIKSAIKGYINDVPDDFFTRGVKNGK